MLKIRLASIVSTLCFALALDGQVEASQSNVFMSGTAAKGIASIVLNLRAQGRISGRFPDTASITVIETSSGYAFTIAGLGDGAVQFSGVRRTLQSVQTAAFSEVLGTNSLDAPASQALLTTLDYVQGHPATAAAMNAQYDSGDFIVGIHRNANGIFVGLSYPAPVVVGTFIGCIASIRQFKFDPNGGAVTELRPACS
jgi:hypothetical protein